MFVCISSKFSLESASLTDDQPLLLAPRAERVENEAEHRGTGVKSSRVLCKVIKGPDS